MSGREWKPGDIGVTAATYQGEVEVRFLVDEGPVFRYQDGDVDNHPPRDDARPLVVIDPEDREQVERLRDALQVNPGDAGYGWKWVQRAIRSFLTPDEPTDPRARVLTESRSVEWAAIHVGGERRWVTDGGLGITWGELVRDHPDAEVQS